MKKLICLWLVALQAFGAIAFVAAADGGNNGNSTASLTYSYTTGAGSNRLLLTCITGDTAADDISSVTYNGVAMTQIAKVLPPANRWSYFYYLLAPASGAHNLVITFGSIHFIISGSADYSGVKQSAQPDASTTNTGSPVGPADLATSLTTSANNSWVTMCGGGFSGSQAQLAGTGATRRAVDGSFGTWGLFDSNAVVTPAGSYSIGWHYAAGVAGQSSIVASFAPAVTAAAMQQRKNAAFIGLF